MKLQEEIRRIQEMIDELSEELVQVNPTRTLYHLSRYTNRESILKNGLKPQVGGMTDKVKDDNPEIEDFVYLLYAPSNIDKTMFGNDVWEIDTNNLDIKLYKDPNHPTIDKWFVTRQHIPPSNLKLVSSDEERDDYFLSGEYHKDMAKPYVPPPTPTPIPYDPIWDVLNDPRLKNLTSDDYVEIPKSKDDEIKEESLRIKEIMGINEETNPRFRRRYSSFEQLILTINPCDYNKFEEYLDGIDNFIQDNLQHIEWIKYDEAYEYVKKNMILDLWKNYNKKCLGLG